MTWAIFLKVGIVSVWSIVEKTLNHILSGFLEIILCQSREWATAREWPDLDQQYTLSFHRFISREDAFSEGHSCGHCWPGTGSYAATLASKELALQAVMKHGYPAGRALLSLLIFLHWTRKLEDLCSWLDLVLLSRGEMVDLGALASPSADDASFHVSVRREELDFLT